MGNRIVISESQYNRLFLNGVDIVDTIFINEQNKKNNIIILPGANAGAIQEFLKSKGFYSGNIDYDFGDKSAESFGKYYRKFGPIKTIEELYDELNVMRYDVGAKTGKLFGPKMAKVISDLIKKKESKSGDKVLQTSEKCRPVCNVLTDEEFEETARWIFSSGEQKVTNSKELINKNLLSNKNNCTKCHAVYCANGLNDRINSPDGDLSYLPSFGEMLQYPELAKQHPTLFDAFNQASIVGAPNAFDKYLATWTVQDWIDAAATVAFAVAIVFPPAALIGLGLEGVNVAISSYKLYTGEGSVLDLAIRTIFLFGGPIIGRMIGKAVSLTFNAIKNIFVKVLSIFKRIGGKKLTEEAVEKIVREEFKHFSKEERELAENLLEEIKMNPERFKHNIDEIEKLSIRVENGDRAAIAELKKAQEKAIRRGYIDEINPFSGNKTEVIETGFGQIKVNKYWADIVDFPRTKLGLTIFLGIFISMEAYGFYTFLEKQGYSQEQIRDINSLIEKEVGLEDKIESFFKKYADNEKPTGDIEDDMTLLISNGLENEEFEELKGELDVAMLEYEKYHIKSKTELDNIKNDESNLSWVYNGFCSNDKKNNVVKNLNNKKGTKNYNIKEYGIPYKEYYFILKGKYKGIWKRVADDLEKSKGGLNDVDTEEVFIGGIDMVKLKNMKDSASENYIDIVSNCEESIPIVNDFCKSQINSKKVLNFCASIELINLSKKEEIDLIIDVRDGRHNDDPLTQKTQEIWDDWE